MSRIFRRAAHPDHGSHAHSSSSSTTNPGEGSAVSHSHPAPSSPERHRFHLPPPAELLHHSPTTSTGSPVSSKTTPRPRFDSRASDIHSLDVNISDTTSSTARQGSSISSHANSLRRNSSNPPSPRSSSSSLPRHNPANEHGRASDEVGTSYNNHHCPDDGHKADGRRDRSLSSATAPPGNGHSTPNIDLASHPKAGETSQTYPGVVLGSFADAEDKGALEFGVGEMRFDGPMDDILDPHAAPRSDGRHGSASGGQAAPNIAPWLSDDSPKQQEPPQTPTETAAQATNYFAPKESPRKHSIQVLNHFSSVPALPKIRKQGTVDTVAEGPSLASSRNGSQSSITPSSSYLQTSDTSSKNPSRSRLGSSESIQTLSASQRGKKAVSVADEMAALPPLPGGGRHPSVAGARMARYGSTASTSTAGSGSMGSDKRKGFLGGFLKRKTGQSVSQPGLMSDFNPSDMSHRGSTSGSTSSRLSTSTSIGSLSSKRSPPIEPPSPVRRQGQRQGQSFASEGGIPALHEVGESEFTLDMNLDDMEGIVDPTLANAPPTAPASKLPTIPAGSSGQTATTETASTSGSMMLADALTNTSSFATTVSDSSGSGSSQPGSSDQTQVTGRSVVAPAHRQSGDPFVRSNPFQAGSPHGSIDGKAATPPSPHSLTLSPKHVILPSTQPRRPSQLRNVKMGSTDSEASNDQPENSYLQPLAPAWASGAATGLTLFNDPFGSAASPDGLVPEGVSPSRLAGEAAPSASQSPGEGPIVTEQRNANTSTSANINANGSTAPAIAPIIGPGAAWAAPESWGVEGDENMPEDATSSDDDDWAAVDEEIAGVPTATTDDSIPSPPITSSTTRKPPPFGYKSNRTSGSVGESRPGTSTGGRRLKTASGRPSTVTRPNTSHRPGTAGSTHLSTLPHWIRIYRADGTYTLMSFPVNTTASEIISTLIGATDAGKKASTNMRLYLRERGQDRQILPSEKPLAIQDRRLRHAGYTEAENVEEVGKADLYILCKFIYQVPNLPVMSPEEESLYDSFEFIDFAGRDLQTIPIFLHLHAHNIIILNISKNPMTDLPLDFIQACTSLKELRMSYMALKRIPTSICASTTLSRLDVSCNRIADLESVPLHEITTLLSLKIQNNKLTSMPAYFAQMKALKYLNISNNKFEIFPAVVSEMSNLVDLDISFNEIAELPSEMSNLKSLERLAAFGNELTAFPASFSTLANLRVLDVRRNKLTDLNSVYALPNITSLQADNNVLVTLDAQIGAKVRQFSVPHNSITRFTLAPLPNTKAVTYALTHLNLSHGKLSTLADEAFSGLINLAELKLDFNQFTRLPSTLDRLLNLEVLSCTDNLLEALPKGIGRMSKLRILNAHNNNIKSVAGDLWMCPSIESINLSSNLLNTTPDPPTLAELVEILGSEVLAKELMDTASGGIPPAGRSLRRLFLADNRFSDDIFHSIALLSELRVVNLSFNDIFEIPSGTISKNDKLEALYLSGNKLTSLPSEDLEKLQNLQVLHLNGNKLQTLPSELGALTSLQHLDVGSNVLKYNIANWPYDWNWNWNTALRYLNLSGNKRLEIKPTSAQDMSHASSFRKDLSDFNALTQLRLLGLMDVTLRIPSLPDESDEKRVRTSFSDINNMAYGISDMIGSTEHLAMFDMVIPNFRGKENECIFGMFGRATSSSPAGKIPKFLQENFASALSLQLDTLKEGEDISTAVRRSFLYSNRTTFEHLMGISPNGRKGSVASFSSVDSMFKNWSPSPTSHFRHGSSGAIVYLVDKTMHVGNVGDCLVVLSRKGEAELLSKYHDPTDREETARIRRAEAWVSTKGYINDEKDIDISRAIGYYQNFPAVNASPEVCTRKLDESDEFVIIGNHALWKCCSYQTAIDIARTERGDPMMAAQKLRDFAISYGAVGSVMVMVVNISDLFYGRGRRARTAGGSTGAPGEPGPDGDYALLRDKRNIRRRYEEFGDRTLNRLQQEIEPPQGQVAIVFTDIVNSTHLWETNPGMPTAIKMHHTLMRRQLRLDGGYEVKTEGDSFMVSFQTVTAALLWAFNCQIGLLQQEWPRELLEAHDGKVIYDSDGNLVQRGLRVRMGVHWGQPQCELDPITRRMDYYGPMVNRSARINASADGGQLMASQDVINEVEALRDYWDTLDENSQSDMPPEMKREVAELKKIGFEVKDMGERKLKGLEVPERLHLLYPKSLAGRFETSNNLRANVEVAVPGTHIAEPRHIDIEEVRELSRLALRLEQLCSSHTHSQQPGSPALPLSPNPNLEMTPSKSRHTRGVQLPPPTYLGPSIKDEMNDEELSIVIESLTTRLENAMSTLYLKHLGGFSSVLAALEQATRIDSKMLVHAMALMNGGLGK